MWRSSSNRSRDAEDEGSFEFACEIVSRIVSTRINKIPNEYVQVALVAAFTNRQQKRFKKESAVFLDKSYNMKKNVREKM